MEDRKQEGTKAAAEVGPSMAGGREVCVCRGEMDWVSPPGSSHDLRYQDLWVA